MNDVCGIWSSPWRTLHRQASPSQPASARQATVRQEAVPDSGSWLGRSRMTVSSRTRLRCGRTAAL